MLFAGLSQQRSGFSTWEMHVKFVVLRWVYLPGLQSSAVIIPPNFAIYFCNVWEDTRAPWEVAVPQQHSEVPTQKSKFVTKFVVGHVGHVLLGCTKLGRRWDVRANEYIHNFGGKPTLGRPRIKQKVSHKTYPRHTVCKDKSIWTLCHT
jgi:hypothetical protein